MNKNMPIYIALGANMSSPKVTFSKAIHALEERNVHVLRVSGLWQSPAWPPGSEQADYINATAHVEFSGSAQMLLKILHEIEAGFGRERTVKNAPRTLDLDLLDFRGQIAKTSHIEIPHPRMLIRGFVLFPLQEIAPKWRDPAGKRPIMDHIARLPLDDVKDIQWVGRLG